MATLCHDSVRDRTDDCLGAGARVKRSARRSNCVRWTAAAALLGHTCDKVAVVAAFDVQEVFGLDLARHFERLWGIVVVGQASRGVVQEAPSVRRACQFGVDNATYEISRILLGRGEVEILDVFDAPVVSSGVNCLSGGSCSSFLPFAVETAATERHVSRLEAEFGGRVYREARNAHGRSLAEPLCDLVLFSDYSVYVSIERISPYLSGYAVMVWVSGTCSVEVGDKASPRCHFLNTFWTQTSLMRRGYCSGGVCMSRVPVGTLADPNALPLNCAGFMEENGSDFAAGEFSQDWYLFWNLFRRRHKSVNEGGVYVDVGAAMPFDYSNTVLFERCLGWRGVCVEPNPYFAPFLHAYRSCEVFQSCVHEIPVDGHQFTERDGTVAFAAACRPLEDILVQAGLERPARIDLLSIDVEHGEMSVLRSLNLQRFDIRVILIEVTRGARELEVDTILLPVGYAKIAILGRDAVYVKLEELEVAGLSTSRTSLPSGEPLELPSAWATYHQRVLDDEMEEEMRRERAAFYAGLRRR